MGLNREFIREVGPARWVCRTLIRQFSKRVLSKGNNIVLPTGLPMHLPKDSRFSSEVFITQCSVDWGSEKLLATMLDPARAFLDIGANVGYYSLYMLPCVAAVHAFEPDSRAATHLRRNLSAYPNAFVHPIAVGDRVGRAAFVEEGSSETSHLSDSGKEIGVTTVDRFVAERQLSICGIKIDVEGADMEVLEGAAETLRTQRPVVLVETAPTERLFNFAGPLGYRAFAFVRTPQGFQYREIAGNDPAQTKMLFLVHSSRAIQGIEAD